MFIALLTIVQFMAVGLGVGSSTLAIINFLVAVSDGKIDEHERKMMGVVYVVLRVAMVLILITTIAISVTLLVSVGSLTAYFWQILTLVTILFCNSILMTLHKLPSAFGPAIQASAWYTLGFINSLLLVGWAFTYLQFLLTYVTLTLFATAFINVMLLHFKHKKG